MAGIWAPSDTPEVPSAGDTAPVELGVKFSANTPGSVAGVCFHKGEGNDGTHTGSLWTADGVRLASAIFEDETESGWQTVTFAEPVPIEADTTYVASYFAPQGRYSVTYDYFAEETDNGPLHTPASTEDDPNGVFRYASSSGFPTATHRSSNYWVDVLFTPGPAPARPAPLDQGFGGPVLLVTSSELPFSRYYSEILRAEGINSFATADLAALDADGFGEHDVVILAELALTDDQVAMFAGWVSDGGNLIAMRPDKKLADLLGLSDHGETLAEGYLLIDTEAAPGAGLPSQTMQFHGTADLYTALDGTTTIATLYGDPETATGSPAVTLRNVGTDGGQAVAFTYDLARSIIYTRQGNPAWAGQERDAEPPRRPVDLFFGPKQGDVQPDWVNLDKVAIPQADEQQRLLSNIIAFVNRDRKPIPRTWYLPRGLKAVVVMALDDHGTATGTADFFDVLKANSPAGGTVENWEALRATSWMFIDGPTMTDAEALAYTEEGFDLGIHVNTGCADWTPISLEAFFHSELRAFAERFPSLPPQTGNRTHCIAWSDWATEPKVELSKGIRIDLNYYYAPSWWVRNRPGMFTGSGLPMRFADLDGTMIDVYQVGTHLVDENGQTYPAGIDTLLDRAIGFEGYYGVFGTHYYFADDFGAQLIASAAPRGVPIVSAKQVLDWTDGRNNSAFSQIRRRGPRVSFTAHVDGRTNGMLRGMLPMQSPNGALTSITLEGVGVDFAQETVKGVTYAMFAVDNGDYVATYTPHPSPASFWTPATVPGNITANDHTAGELGVKFTPAISGRVTAVKFYKGPDNAGPHTVSVWSSTGTRLATAEATDEIDTGWQTVELDPPVNVTAGRTYIASYFAPTGRYSYDYDYFVDAYTNGPLTAPSSVGSGGNGVFNFGSNFPDKTFQNINYWVDVVFRR